MSQRILNCVKKPFINNKLVEDIIFFYRKLFC